MRRARRRWRPRERSAPCGSTFVPAGATSGTRTGEGQYQQRRERDGAGRTARAPRDFSYSHGVRLDGMGSGSKCVSQRCDAAGLGFKLRGCNSATARGLARCSHGVLSRLAGRLDDDAGRLPADARHAGPPLRGISVAAASDCLGNPARSDLRDSLPRAAQREAMASTSACSLAAAVLLVGWNYWPR